MKTVKVSNCHVFISDSWIPAYTVFFVEQGDLMYCVYVGKWLSRQTIINLEVSWLQNWQTGKTAEEIQHVWHKVNIPTFAISCNI